MNFCGLFNVKSLFINKWFYYKQFIFAFEQRLIINNIFQAIQFSQTVLFQTIQFSMSIVLIYTKLNIETVLFWTIQFSVSTVSMSQQFHFKEFSLV